MKAKIVRGHNFRGILLYVFQQKKNWEIVSQNMISNKPNRLNSEFRLIASKRPDIKKAVWQCSLALPVGERLPSDRWDNVVRAFMKDMGFASNAPFIAVRHADTQYDHVHIIASRVALDGSVWLGRKDVFTAMRVTQDLERRFGLQRTQGFERRLGLTKQKKSEIEMSKRLGEQSPREVLQNLVLDAIKPCSVLDFVQELHSNGVTVRPNLAKTGKLNGFSFEFGGVAFKGSDLGKSCTWKNLQRAGIKYDQNEDYQKLLEITSEQKTKDVISVRDTALKEILVDDFVDGKMSTKDSIKALIEITLDSSPKNLTEFVIRLNETGIIVHRNMSKTTGRLNGISYELNGDVFKGSDLGKKYSVNGLAKLGVKYDIDQRSEIEALTVEGKASISQARTGELANQERVVDSSRQETDVDRTEKLFESRTIASVELEKSESDEDQNDRVHDFATRQRLVEDRTRNRGEEASTVSRLKIAQQARNFAQIHRDSVTQFSESQNQNKPTYKSIVIDKFKTIETIYQSTVVYLKHKINAIQNDVSHIVHSILEKSYGLFGQQPSTEGLRRRLEEIAGCQDFAIYRRQRERIRSQQLSMQQMPERVLVLDEIWGEASADVRVRSEGLSDNSSVEPKRRDGQDSDLRRVLSSNRESASESTVSRPMFFADLDEFDDSDMLDEQSDLESLLNDRLGSDAQDVLENALKRDEERQKEDQHQTHRSRRIRR